MKDCSRTSPQILQDLGVVRHVLARCDFRATGSVKGALGQNVPCRTDAFTQNVQIVRVRCEIEINDRLV